MNFKPAGRVDRQAFCFRAHELHENARPYYHPSRAPSEFWVDRIQNSEVSTRFRRGGASFHRDERNRQQPTSTWISRGTHPIPDHARHLAPLFAPASFIGGKQSGGIRACGSCLFGRYPNQSPQARLARDRLFYRRFVERGAQLDPNQCTRPRIRGVRRESRGIKRVHESIGWIYTRGTSRKLFLDTALV